MLLNPGEMDLYSEILPYNPIQGTPLLTFTQPDSFSTIFSYQGEVQVKRKKKTNQANIFYTCCGRRQETCDCRNLTASNTLCWGSLKTNGGHRTRPGVSLYLSLTLSTPRLRSDTRWEPEIIPARSAQSSEPWLPAKTRSDTCINTAEREKRNSISIKRPLSKRRLLNSMKTEIHTQEECQGDQPVARAPHHDLHQLLSPS